MTIVDGTIETPQYGARWCPSPSEKDNFQLLAEQNQFYDSQLASSCHLYTPDSCTLSTAACTLISLMNYINYTLHYSI